MRNVGLVVEYNPATVETRVRFPDVAFCFFTHTIYSCTVALARSSTGATAVLHVLVYVLRVLYCESSGYTASRIFDCLDGWAGRLGSLFLLRPAGTSVDA